MLIKDYQIPYVYYFFRALILTFVFAVCAFVTTLSLSPRPVRFKMPFKASYVVLVMMAVFVITMLAVNFTQHNSLGYRLHSSLNLLTNICHGRLTYTMHDFGSRASIFHHHLYPIFLFIAPFFKILGANAYVLIFLQTAVTAIGVLPVYWASSKRLGEFAGIAFSLAYLLNSIIWISNIWGITAHAFAVPFLCFFLYYLIEKRYALMAVFGVFTLFCGEVMAAVIFMFGLYLIFIHRKTPLGIALAVLSVLYALAAIKISILSLSGVYSHQKAASSLIGMASSPRLIIEFFTQLHPKKIIALFLLLFQTGYLGIFALPFLFVMLPAVFINFVGPWASDIKTSYVWAPLVPIAIFSAILGAARLSKAEFFKKNKNGPAAISLYVLVSALVGYLLFNPFAIYTLDKSGDRFTVQKRDIRIREALKGIPAEASVACTFNISSQLAGREDICFVPGIPVKKPKYTFVPDFKHPYVQDADYVVIDIYDDFLDIGSQNPVIQEILGYQDYSVIDFTLGVITLKKGPGRNFYGFVKAGPEQRIEHEKKITFQNKMVFLGYDIGKPAVRPGSTATLTYFWKPLVDLDDDYLVMTNLYRTYDTKSFQHLHEPLYGVWPTSRWKAGDVIKDEFTIQLPKGIVITERPFVIEVYLMEKLQASTDNIIKKKYLRKEIERSSPNIIGELYIEPDL